MELKPRLTIGDLQHGAFVSLAQRLGLERSTFEPLRFIGLRERLGIEGPERLIPLPFGQVPAVQPSQSMFATLGLPPSGKSGGFDMVANLISGFGGAPDPTDIDPTSGKPRLHQMSLFKTMSAPTRFLPSEIFTGQIGVPFNSNNLIFDTKRAMATPYAVAPSPAMVGLYHRIMGQ